MRERENLKMYSNRYWEIFNEINRNFDDVYGLPAKHGLRKSLTRKPVESMCQLMDCIDKYKRVEEDQQQGKGKAKVVPQDRRDFRLDRYNNDGPRRDFARQSGSTAAQVVSAVFRESVHQILEQIKNEPYFKWPNKMRADPTKRNQSLHYQYH
ncbi:uncharacterized protein LOC142606446 [Castanea sativa]|uniref:uncharacterized protein LOC142606446 n=1 Tax=Castanea sativa TaxID=21020 RepID=UPI003F6529AD